MRRRGRRLPSRARRLLRALLAFLFSNVGVVVLVLGYTIAGAFMFQAIEGAGEIERVTQMARERDSMAEYLWQNVTLTLNLFNETALKERISVELQQYQRKVVMAVRRGWDGAGGRASRQWSFSSAFLYSLTVITTIGYGHILPRSSWGKISTIFYALLGMPLFLLYLTNVGELLARWFKCIYALACLCRGCPGFTRRRVARLRTQIELSEEESIERPDAWDARDAGDAGDAGDAEYSESDTPHYRIPHAAYMVPTRRPEYMRSGSAPQPWVSSRVPPLAPPISGSDTSDFSYVTFDAQTITVPISVCVCIMVGYIVFGSMIFGIWEKWSQLDGAYFCFISLSSIGFGDFVPGEHVYTARIETSFIVCSMYLMLGMALIAMCFSLMQEQVIHYFAGLKRALKRICRCKR